MADLDNLIDELFPGDDAQTQRQQQQMNTGEAQLNWDSEDDENGVESGRAKQSALPAPHAGNTTMASSAAKSAAHPVVQVKKMSLKQQSSDSRHCAKTTTAPKTVTADDARPKPPRSFDDSSTTTNSSDDVSADVKPLGTATGIRPTTRPTVPARHSFDDDSDDDVAAGAPSHGAQQRPHRLGVGRLTDRQAHTTNAAVNDGVVERPSTAQRVLFTVPFPSVPAPETVSPPCRNRCTVSRLGCKKNVHPSLMQLRQVAKGAFDTTCDRKEMLLKKGAFHESLPQVGNGVLDNGGDLSEPGGCPHTFCLKCHHTVVRLQGAQWCDADGDAVDLYLTMRNFYPDWSRLATSNVVGATSDEEQCLALRANSAAAAYCCQCSWLTVLSDKEMIETSLTTAVTYKNSDQSLPFTTVLPRRDGEERRPPLWVCKGHSLCM